MTNKKLNTSFTFRVVIAALIAAAIIFLPAAVLAETEGTTDFGGEPAADLSTPESGVGDTASLPEAPAPDIDSNPLSQTFDLSEVGGDSGEPEPIGVGDDQAPNSGHEGNSYTAEVTSERVLATSSVDADITVSFTEVGHVTPLGSVQMTLPDGFSNLNLVEGSITVSTSDGSSKIWTGGVVGLVLTLMAQDEHSYLGYGESVSASLTANTPAETGIYTLATKAWTDNAAQDLTDADGHITNKNNMAAGHSDPTVGIFTINSPVAISDAAGLAYLSTLILAADLALDYKQTANIDLTDYLAPGGAGYNGGEGWIPIGTAGTPFTGTYNGQGYTISNLFIDRAADTQGLFGFTDAATLTNIALVNVNIKGNTIVGGLVGINGGTITNSYATGAVTGTNRIVGGLVGWNDGAITNSYATGTVTGTGSVGGLVGDSSYGGTITNCFYDETTTGQSDTGKGFRMVTADMQKISTYTGASWTIVPYDPNLAPASDWYIEDNAYPKLFWQHPNYTNQPDPGPPNQPDPGPIPGTSFGFYLGSGLLDILPFPQSNKNVVLTNISGLGSNAVITPAFVAGGNATDLGMAIAAYNQAKQSFEANKGTMNTADKAVAEVELAVANTAILALDLSLAAQSGQAVDLSALIAAYQAAIDSA